MFIRKLFHKNSSPRNRRSADTSSEHVPELLKTESRTPLPRDLILSPATKESAGHADGPKMPQMDNERVKVEQQHVATTKAHEMTTTISTRTGKEAVQEARKRAMTIDVEDDASWTSIPLFDLSELSFGQFLGRGGFCDVYEVSAKRLQSHSRNYSAPTSTDGTPASSTLISTESSMPSKLVKKEEEEADTDVEVSSLPSPPGYTYAVKHLSAARISCQDDFIVAAKDLVCEARILAKLSHPNIITLRGLPASGLEGLDKGQCTGYFLILDRLEGTLEDAFNNIDDVYSEFSKRRRYQLQHLTYLQQEDHFIYRLKVARDIASAVAYLHQHNIIYRDLKPSNVGFDNNKVTKLFDFGLAKELSGKATDLDDEEYKLTGAAGSYRYMAPEVRQSGSYNLSCDVYSFSILLWQMLSLKKPFLEMEHRSLSDTILFERHRPKINAKWHPPIQKLLKDGWHADLHKRPRMADVVAVIESELRHCRGKRTEVSQSSVRSWIPRITSIHCHVSKSTTESA